MKIYVAVLLFLSLGANAMNIERVEYLGASDDGSKIAVFRSHFGASSNAPFAKIQILEYGKLKPIFEDGVSMLAGDEDTMKSLKKELLRKTTKALEVHRIGSVSPLYVDAISYDFSNQILIEMDIRRNDRDLQRYNLRFYESTSDNCPNQILLNTTISKINLPVENIEITDFVESCFINNWKFSKAMRIKNYVWLQFWLFMEPMPGLNYGEQFILSTKL